MLREWMKLNEEINIFSFSMEKLSPAHISREEVRSLPSKDAGRD